MKGLTMKLRPIVAVLALAIPFAGTATPAVASISKPCTFSWYYTGGGYAYKLFTQCSAGTQFHAQRAHINCNNGMGFGLWQPSPGPWAGSTATCPSGGHAVGTSYAEFV